MNIPDQRLRLILIAHVVFDPKGSIVMGRDHHGRERMTGWVIVEEPLGWEVESLELEEVSVLVSLPCAYSFCDQGPAMEKAAGLGTQIGVGRQYSVVEVETPA